MIWTFLTKLCLVVNMRLNKDSDLIKLFTRVSKCGEIEYMWGDHILAVCGQGQDILRCEQMLYRRWLGWFFSPEDIEVKGEALRRIPHGFTCIHGTKQAMERIQTTKPVFLFRVGTRVDLEDRLRSQFKLTGPLHHGGLIRLDFVYDKLDIAASDYMLVIQENEDKITIPGGKRHLGESSIQCAERELMEETGIHRPLDGIVPVYNEQCRANYYLVSM
jgi:hypothetical protein